MTEPRLSERSIFESAIEKSSPQERTAYLDQVCKNDAQLRREIEALLAAHDDLGDLSTPIRTTDLVATIDDPISERPGTMIGPYKLLEQIGEGGFGVVFLAEQQQPLRRKVALKILKPGMDTRQVVIRFEAERQALALMDHPHIAHVFDGGETATGRPYFVMELVRGISITDFCDQNSLCICDRLELFVNVCQAVQHAHQKGIIHRDIKPSNVLVTLHDGTPIVKVIDFGIAKATGQQLTDKTLFTHFAQMIGTPLYMSPEQAGMSGLDVDTRSDIYSLGVLLYELLTGTTPFGRERLREASYDELRRIIREEEPSRPSTRISTLGQAATTLSNQRQCDAKQLSRLIRGELDWIVMKALEKDRNRRYATANAFTADVQRYLHDESVLACPPSAAYRLRKFARRNKTALATAGLVSTVLLLGTVASCYFAVQANARAREAGYAERRARLREADALVGQAHGTRLSRRPGQRFDTLTALRKAADIGRELGQPPQWFDRLRNEAIAALALPDVHITHEFGSFPRGSHSVELNEDFTLYVRTTGKGGCTIRRVDDDTEVARLPDLGESAVAQFGAGRMLAVLATRSRRFQLWDLRGAEAVLRFEAHGIHCWKFRNDGRLLALSHLDGAISVYETASGKRVHKLAPEQIFRGLVPSLHPTAPFVACHDHFFQQGVLVRDLRSGAIVAKAMTCWSGGSQACWSPDGRTLLVADSEHSGIIQEHAFDPAVGVLRLVRTLQGPDMGGVQIAYNSAGDRFVSRSWTNQVQLFDAVSGQVLFSVPSLPSASGYVLRFDRTGRRLAGARVGDRIGIWSVADAREYHVLAHAGNGVNESAASFQPAIHPAARLAAIGSAEGVALFDLETGHELARLPIHDRLARVSFDGTGSLLINGYEGFFGWSVTSDGANPRRLTVGPPVRLPFHPGSSEIAASHDGRVIAQCMWGGYGMEAFAGGWILHPNSPTPRRVEAGASIGWCSVSPDGRWVAFGGPKLGAGRAAIKVYETATAQPVWQSPVGGYHVLFSPDGRWLVTDADGGRLYTVGTWEPGPQLGPGMPWDVTSHLAVFGQTNGIYCLVELATGRELARLEDPELNAGAAVFTPDGTKLVVSTKNGLRVWDLRRIRTELAKLGLDWDAPPLPAAPPGTDATPLAEAPLSIHVESGQISPGAQALWLGRQADLHTRAKEHAKALAARRQAVRIAPSLAEAHNNLAWLLLAGPKGLRDPAQALIEAKIAVELEPKQFTYVNTLGAALYYAGQYAEAIPVLERSLGEGKRKNDAFDLFFLAMCHHRLGNAAKATDCRQRGKRWFQEHKGVLTAGLVEELTAFQAETESVLAQPPGQAKK